MSNTKNTGVPVKELHGITYFKLQSDYPGDYTKNCGLLGNEIDENFYFLRSNDIKTGYTEDIDSRKYLVLVKVDDEEIRIDITDTDAYQFKVQDGYIYITFPDGSERRMGDEYDGGTPVRFLVEGDNVHIVTDASIQGDGSYGNPIGVDLAYRTGTYAPADYFIDLTCTGATLALASGIGYAHAVVSKENVSRFGALYTFDEAKKIDAALKKEGRGWRLPTKEDWAKLLNWAEGDCPECQNHDTNRSGNFGCIAGSRLKSKEYWAEGPHPGLDDFGMAIYPVGVCPETYNAKEPEKYGFTGLYKTTSFWTSSEKDGEVYVRTFSYAHDDVAQFTESIKKRLSIRLVRDVVDDFDISDYALILGDYIPVTLTTDGTQLWTTINVSVVNYDGYNPNGVTVPEEWEDVETDIPVKAYYMLKGDVDGGFVEYELIDEYDLPSYAEPVSADDWDIMVDEKAEMPYAGFLTRNNQDEEFVYLSYTAKMNMLTEAKFFYNAWDGERWHKKLMYEGESVVLLREDYPNPCHTGETPYVTSENGNHEWRVYTNEETGLDELIDVAAALKEEFAKELKEIKKEISGLTENLNTLSGFVGDMYDEMQSGFTSAFTAIDEAQAEIDKVEESVGLDEDGNYIAPESGFTAGSSTIAEAISMLDEELGSYEEKTDAELARLDENLTELSGTVEDLAAALDVLQGEVDTAEEAIGLNEDGTHKPSEGNFTSSAETIEEEILALDSVLTDAVADIEELKERTVEAKDDSIEVEISGNTTYIRVKRNEDDPHLKLDSDGLYFDGDFGLI